MDFLQTLDIRGKKFVLIPESEYRRLTRRSSPVVPALPPKSSDGTYPAAAAMRAMMARKIIAAPLLLDCHRPRSRKPPESGSKH